MNKLTKEQIGLFTAIAVIVMLVAFFFVKFDLGFFRVAAVELIGEVGWFGTITLILAMLAPIYTCLYAFRNRKELEPLKVIFGIKPGLAYALPLISLSLVAFGAFMSGGWPVILYAAAASAVLYFGKSEE